MKKTITTVLLLMLLAIGTGWYLLATIRVVPPIFLTGAVVTEKGTVLDNMIHSAANQPMYLKVKKSGGILSGATIKVRYHEKNITCVKDAMNMRIGTSIEVHGVAISDDTISTCGADEYYVRVIADLK